MRELARALPHNAEAEEAVIGGLLFSGRSISQLGDLLDPDDFYDPGHGAIFAAMRELERQSAAIDLLTVSAELRRNGTMQKLQARGSEVYLCELANKVATAENIDEHAKLIRDKATIRRMILAASAIVEQGYGDDLDTGQFLDQAQQAIYEITNRQARSAIQKVRQVMPGSLAELKRRVDNAGAVVGVPSGFRLLDKMTTGFLPNNLIIVAARPSMGKTALALCIAQNASLGHQIPVLIFSLEMSKSELTMRLWASEARVNSQGIRSGEMDKGDWNRLLSAAVTLDRSPIYIDDSSAPTLMEIRAKARRWRADRRIFPQGSGQLGLVIIDYLQLVQAASRKDGNREREVSEISRGLKSLAKDLELPVIALSQLSRSLESRADKRPQLSDLRESGAIEQDADLICFIYRDEVYNKKTERPGVAEIILAKQRNGPIGMVELAFVNQYTRFDRLEQNR